MSSPGVQQYLLKAKRTTQYVKHTINKIQAKQGLKITAERGLKVTTGKQLHVLGTVRHYLTTDKVALKYRGNTSKADMQILFLIDSSGSMVKDQQIAYMKGLIQQTITHYKGKRLKYAAVALSQGEAQLLSPFTLDAERLLNTITGLQSGGKTNLKAGLTLIHQLVPRNVQLYIFTDGKINAGGTFEDAVTYYKTYLKQLKTTVINNETGFVQLGLAEKLAKAIGAKYISYE